MKRQVGLYVGFSLSAALCAAGAVASFVYGVIYMGVIASVVAAVAVLWLATAIAQDNFNLRCGKLCEEKKYEEERALIEKKMKSPFFFLIRIVALTRYIRVSMALDDLPTAKRYIDSLRHGGGEGWKYKTAFFFILIKLDEGDFETARFEYEDFRRACANAEIYKEELEILSAIYRRLLKTDTEPLPAAAVDSPFPVLGRVLGRIYEARAAQSGEEW